MKQMNTLLRTVAVPVSLVAGLSLMPGIAAASPADAETAGILITLDDAASRTLAPQVESDIQLLSASPVMTELADAGLEVSDANVSHDDTVMVAADAPEGMTDAQALDAARNIEGVAAVQYNYVYHLIDFVDGSLADGYSDSTAGGVSLQAALSVNDPIAKVASPSNEPNQYWAYRTHLTDAWQDASSDHAITVATIDSGAELDHEDLQGNVLSDLAWDATVDKPLASCEIQDSAPDHHGTMTAGIVAAVANNRIGLAGASNNAFVLPIKVVQNDGESISSEDICAAYDYIFELIDNHRCTSLRVVNMSLGSYTSLGKDSAFHAQIKKALNEYGILTVCSGGNTGSTKPNYPSDLDECVSVISLGTDENYAWFTDCNEYKDICAPGENIFSTGTNSGYASADGTSLSAPMVSGTIALMYAVKPDATPNAILEALYETAAPVEDTGGFAANGSHGQLDADAAIAYLTGEGGQKPEPEPSALPFTDVAASAWYYDAIGYVYEKNIMGGYSDVAFGPENAVLREQVATILYRYFGEPAVNGGADYSDAASGAYYEDAIVWAEQQGFMSGYGDGRFGVGEPLTREQLAIVVANVADAEIERANDTKFNALPDHNTVNGWARDEVVWAVDTGIINGVEQPGGVKLLSPQQTCTRAQMATIFMNCVEQDII